MDVKQEENYNSSNSHSGEDDEEIRCRCGQNVDSGALMICCDQCEFWQHAECYYGNKKEKMPDKFFCHICQPKADMFKYIVHEEIKNELLIDWQEYAKKNKKKRKKKKNQEDYNFNTKEVAVLERYWKHYCKNILNRDLSDNILRAVAVLFNCKIAIIHEVFYNMALDIQQLSQPSLILGVDIKDPYSGWKLKNENIYTKVSENITKPKEVSDPGCLDNPQEDFLKVDKVDSWEMKDIQTDPSYIEYGVFPKKVIEDNQLIIEFYGKFTTWDAYRNLKGKLTKPNFRGLVFPDKGLCIDATKHGNISRYLRRSCTPNAKIVEKWIDGKMRVGIFAGEKIDVGKEITIPFDYPYGSLRNGMECACSKKAECPVQIWYIERKKLSDSFIQNNKIDLSAIPVEKEVKPIVEVKKTKVEPEATPPVTVSEPRASRRRNSSKLSREERKLQSIVETIERMEEKEKRKTSKSPKPKTRSTTPSNTLKTSTNSMISNANKKKLFGNNRESSPTAKSLSPNNNLNKKTLGQSSQGLTTNGSRLSSKSPASKTNITNKVKSEPSNDPKARMVGKKAWMNKYFNEENESKSEENGSPNNEEESSSIVSPVDQSLDKQNNTSNNTNSNSTNTPSNVNTNQTQTQFKQEVIGDQNMEIVNNTHIKQEANGGIHHETTAQSSNGSSIVVSSNPIPQNSTPPQPVPQTISQQPPTSSTSDNMEIVNTSTIQPNHITSNTTTPQLPTPNFQNSTPQVTPTPSILTPITNNTNNTKNGSDVQVDPPSIFTISNKRKLEQSNNVPEPPIVSPVIPPLPPSSPPASPPDIGPELPPDQKKRKNSNNLQEIINQTNNNVNANTPPHVLNPNLAPNNFSLNLSTNNNLPESNNFQHNFIPLKSPPLNNHPYDHVNNTNIDPQQNGLYNSANN